MGTRNFKSRALATTDTVQEPPPDQKQQTDMRRVYSPWREALKRFLSDRRALVSTLVLLLMLLIATFGPFIYQHVGISIQSDLVGRIGPERYHVYYHEELSRQDQLPSQAYWLGTDSVGRDILARLMQGLLISFTVAIMVEIVDVGMGLIIGLLAGYYGGWIDQFLARFTDIMFAFPSLLFALLLVGVFGPRADNFFESVPLFGDPGNARLLIVSVALAFTAWPLMARYVRGQTLQLKERQFIEAARTVGTPDGRIIIRHIIPNLFSLVFIASTLNIAGTIIGEAGLSLLGVGVQDPGSSLGLMIADALEVTESHPWEIFVPTCVLTIIVLAISFIGDGLRDAFDPHR